MIDRFKRWAYAFKSWIVSIDPLAWLLFAFILNRITDWLPETYIDPFPFYDIMYEGENIGLSWQSYFYFIDLHIIFIAFWHYCYKTKPSMSPLFFFYRAVEVVALIDFLLIYEKPFWYITHNGAVLYGLEFTDIKIAAYFGLYILWKIRS